MNDKIYKSDFKVGPEATEKQSRLFQADLEYAISRGYKLIQPLEGSVLRIIDHNNLVEFSNSEESEKTHFFKVLDEFIASLDESLDPDVDTPTEKLVKEPEQVELSPGDEGYCKHCHNISMIDDIINNTLSQKYSIEPSQADTMLKLAHLQNLLMEQSNA